MAVFILILFLVDFIGNLISEKTKNDGGRMITKPLLMPLLALYYITAAKSPDLFVIAALFCGFLGDVFLMLTGKRLYLKLGIISFMAGHIFYIIKFSAAREGLTSVNVWSLPALAIYIAYGLYVYMLLHSKLGPLKIPAGLYLGIILIMSFTSLTVLLSGKASYIPVFAGSLAFVASDTILAINLFLSKTKNADFIIMLTYVTAQILIIAGLL